MKRSSNHDLNRQRDITHNLNRCQTSCVELVKLEILKLQDEAKADKNNIVCLKEEVVESNESNHSILKLVNSTLEKTWKDQNQDEIKKNNEDWEKLLNKKDGGVINFY